MKIREGAYYRTRGGYVMGPMARTSLEDTKYVWRIGGDTSLYSWTDEGYWHLGYSDRFDLISEVYVSDTPPTVKETEEELREMMRDPRYWQKREPEWVKRVTDGFRALVGGGGEPPATALNGPFFEVYDRKTLRDEFAFEAMKKLMDTSGLKAAAHHEEANRTGLAKLSYGIADAMMEARKK